MAILAFPDPRKTTPEGIVGFGGDLESSSLILAYRQGIFPWPMEGVPLPWFCPPKRAILEFEEIHIPRSLARARRQLPFTYTIDSAFLQVIEACAEAKRPDQNGTWIYPEIIAAYTELHRLGHAHSAEVWHENKLVGGIYGVDAGGAFTGESMFHSESNASKLALLHLCDHLASRGLTWLDIQVMTPHMEKLGARLVTRNRFLKSLVETQERKLRLFA